MKVILNKDLSTLGEEGDVKDVARGYARNYLFPRGIALPYTPKTVKLFESRKDEIEARKTQKRQDALGLKEKLESLELSITMPAGANGKLYGAVTSQTVADELAKQGFQIERKRIDLGVTGFKNTGKYKAFIKLYENSSAEIQLVIIGQAIKTETHHPSAKPIRRRRDESQAAAAAPSEAEAAPSAGQDSAPPDAGAPASVSVPAPESGAEEAQA
ncbi:MAG: 50S ribosomal protein L9 [Treponema sp.]|jgi:large subunit ribosomal protein L9|nr:50S ribosomal protein L9 [Treponema sp.]